MSTSDMWDVFLPRSLHWFLCCAAGDWRPAIKNHQQRTSFIHKTQGEDSWQLVAMKINTLGDCARYFLLFWGIPVGFKSVRLNRSHERNEHTRRGTKLAYSWSQRSRAKSQQFENHIGFFFLPLEIKNRTIYTLYEQKWDFMAVIAVFRGSWIF